MIDRWLSRGLIVIGVAIVAIGLVHIAIGARFIQGVGNPTASVDSEARFFGAVFVGYGLCHIWAAFDVRERTAWIMALAGVMFLGGLARLVSMAMSGLPHALYIGLTAVELVLPLILVALAARTSSTREEKDYFEPA
jgi:predicted acyltransferase